MFSWIWNAGVGDEDDSSSTGGSEEGAWFPPRQEEHLAASPGGIIPRDDHLENDDDDEVNELDELPPYYAWTSEETPGTLQFFQDYKNHLESQLKYPNPELPPTWIESLQTAQAARQGAAQAQKFLDDLQKDDKTPPEAIEKAKQALQQAQAAVDACNETVLMVADSLLTTPSPSEGKTKSKPSTDDDESPSIPEFVSQDFQDDAWVTFVILEDPQHWAEWCCPDENHQTPNPTRVNLALHFLADIATQRRILGEGAGGPRAGNYGGYLEILQKLDSSSAAKEPVLERLAHAVALEFADGDYIYFDTTKKMDPIGRYLHYEQAYLMGDLDPNFSSLEIWELRLAISSSSPDWELQWGRECLQSYRPDLALTDDVQWRYCRLVRTDVGYMNPTWTSSPHTMDQILSGGGECGPRAWFGRFICQAFGIPIWGVRQVGHAAMSRWTEKGWMTCFSAGWPYAWWEDECGFRCGLDFYLETLARTGLASPAKYLQQVMRLEWLAKYQKESNNTITRECTYDPAAPWYALSLAQRHLLAKAVEPNSRRKRFYCRSKRIVSKITRVQAYLSNPSRAFVMVNGEICIPADSTSTAPSEKLLIMPSFLGGSQVYLGLDGVVEYELEKHWLPVESRDYRLIVKVVTAHRKESALLITVSSDADTLIKDSRLDKSQGSVYRLPLPYSKGLWECTETINICLCPNAKTISLQREWNEMYGIAIKEIRLVPC